MFLQDKRIPLIPEPRSLSTVDGCFQVPDTWQIACTEEEDRFSAQYMTEWLQADFGLTGALSASGDATMSLSRAGDLQAEGYVLAITPNHIQVQGADRAGTYYGCQTLRQILQACAGTGELPCLEIRDWPALKYRAMHYDTKHHQGTRAYVEDLIKELAHYKANVLVWEWEDKLAYEKHPEVGAPGAFTMAEMQELQALAQQHHMQIVPLVQGLGHVSFILKHLKWKHLREIPDSNWEFCPLKDGSYELLFDLWREAATATPGSEFIHIGSDETYELGAGEACGCRAKAEEIGKDGLMQIFIRRCVEFCEKELGRKVLSWGGRWQADSQYEPPKHMIFVDSGDPDYVKAAKEAGYACWIYAPNPGITPLAMPLFTYTQHTFADDPTQLRRIVEGTLQKTSETIGRAARAASVEGSITTSWDDSGHHMAAWIPRFVCAADFSWNPRDADVHPDDWADMFFANYFGTQARDLHELFVAFYEGAEFYNHALPRAVWHWYTLGKMDLPDVPHDTDLEFNNFWRIRHRQAILQADRLLPRIERALKIIDDNLKRNVRHAYDLEVFRTCLALILYDIELIHTLCEAEAILDFTTGGNRVHFQDNQQALAYLRQVEAMVDAHLQKREGLYHDLVQVWEKTRLPKGLSLPDKPFVHARDRARHFANRTADMRFLVMDHEALNLEGYLSRLRACIVEYEQANVRS